MCKRFFSLSNLLLIKQMQLSCHLVCHILLAFASIWVQILIVIHYGILTIRIFFISLIFHWISRFQFLNLSYIESGDTFTACIDTLDSIVFMHT